MDSQTRQAPIDVGPLRDGLQALLKAHEYSVDSNRTAWDFAVELARLQRMGITICDLRWLICRNLVEHQAEVLQSGRMGRNFYPTSELKFDDQSCFILTKAGVEFCRATLRMGTANDDEPVRSGATPRCIPKWDADLREFRVNGQLIKRYRLPSPNQEIVLTAFEEEAWPPRIDDPLPLAPNRDPKRRLHDTINSLNRNQKAQVVRFEGDGTGEGVLWRSVGG